VSSRGQHPNSRKNLVPMQDAVREKAKATRGQELVRDEEIPPEKIPGMNRRRYRDRYEALVSGPHVSTKP